MSTLIPAMLTLASPVRAQSAAGPAPEPTVDVGLGRGITIRAADDSASLNIRARLQIRSTLLDGPATDDDATEMSIRRARLVFQGNALGPTLTYYIQLSFSNLDNEADLRLPLRDAYITWAAQRDLNVRLGQMKVPFSRQRVVSSSALQMVDRSIVVSELNLDRDVGVQVFSRDLFGTGKLGYAAGLFGGEGRNRLGRDSGFLYSARLETWPLGAFDDLVEGDLQRRDKLRVAFGANVGYNQNTNRPRSTIGVPYPSGGVDYVNASADAVLKWRGWSVTSEVMYRDAGRQSGTEQPLPVRSGLGAYVQSGWMLSARAEVSGRYSHLAPRSGSDDTFVEVDEAGGGLSYYVRGHDLKVQGDVFVLTEVATNRRSTQGRVQFQLFF